MGEPTVREQFLAEACEAWSNALDDAVWARLRPPESATAHYRWAETTATQREVTAAAMGKFLTWLDSRRF